MSNSQDFDVELADRKAGTDEVDEDAMSAFSRREQRQRMSLLSDRDTTHIRTHAATTAASMSTTPLLNLLRLVQHYNIQIFSIEPDQAWNIRPELGKGASFAVEQAELSVSSTLSHHQYRSLDAKGPTQASDFIDHTKTAWSRDKPVAFKSVGGDNDELSDLITELQVLCHSPLQQHPNIINLLGIVLVMEQNPRDVQAASIGQAVREWTPQEVPILVVEKAPHASLSAFLNSNEFLDIPSSLNAKLRLCADILSGIEVY